MQRPFEDPPVIGDWCREKRLGNGGFGVVTLWRNKQTEQTVAIKKFHILQDNSEITDKHCERWRNEVKLMTEKVQNDNIVRTVAVQPEAFVRELMRSSASGLPILCMEYCEGGDLRRVLNRVENCSGLREQDVRDVLRSLRNAIAYLHSLKITHRDIKPENLVLKQQGDRFVYKLTDLGYAKALDKQSLNASLVGTVEYIAPDLIYCDRYNCSVDYWSMGVIGFEIVTGVRPFIPHSPITKWMLHVQQKKPADIAITEDNRDNYTYHTELFAENHISESLRRQLERWLTLALEWNPKQRGYAPAAADDPTVGATASLKTVKFAEDKQRNGSNSTPPSMVLKIFSLLDQILEKRYLTLFSLYDCRWISLEVTPETDMAQVREEVSLVTGIPTEEVEFILPLEQKQSRVEPNTRPIDLYLPEFYGKPMVFVMHRGYRGSIVQRDLKPRIPKSITDVFQNIKLKLKPHMLRQFIANSYYFIANEQRLYLLLVDGIRNYGLILNDGIARRKDEIGRMNKVVYGILGGVEYHKLTVAHARDALNVGKQISPAMFDSSCQQWEERSTRIETNVRKLAEMADKISKRYDSVLKRSRDSLRHKLLLAEMEQQDHFGLKGVEGRYEQTRARILEKITTEKSHMDMSQAVYECLKRRDVLLRDPSFHELQQQLLDIRTEMQEIEKVLEKVVELTEKYKRELARVTLEHQDEVWKLLDESHASRRVNNGTSNGALLNGTNGSVVPDLDQMMRSVSMDKDGGNKHGRPKFLVGGPMTPLQSTLSGGGSVDENLLCFGEGPNVEDLIAANETLIITTNDLLSDSFTMFK
ncbi:inhibitor of nuclear factor kappa-B kinase subunit beta [Anopheles ziemanni]|uniref:inhibitor of nuclear factor kappa-B kinase subunit beta n=1 Tax=Anopheles coustani TaxID=139045 RepID=UPI00265925EF|nr:inhibitor of nuclear factor kappa-B kinase subunit beta [Anopheles coustani]XP_058124471.1 inhibitor of nuclear factor kappa-B kinase subunit beta [Anopheles coustani]XP_058168615.1 inhibitor of nuclear factor kappa-B kinase subunit beta [Anopheles ziemanni]